MTYDRALQMFQAVACVFCGVLLWRCTTRLGATEFSGGRATGILLNMADLAMMLFFTASAASFFKRRLSAAIDLVASVLALPLYFYFVAPGPFRRIFSGEYSVPASANFVWDPSSIVGVTAVALACCLGVLNVLPLRQNARA
jgi:hypothetical protein